MKKQVGIVELFEEHEAIRFHLNRLESNIDSLLLLAYKDLCNQDDLKTIKGNVRNLCTALYYLKEATDNHEKKDKDLLKDIVSEQELQYEDMTHKQAADTLERTIMQADFAAAEDWNIEELKGCLKGLKGSIRSFHQLALEQMYKEDSIQKLLKSNL